MVRKKKDDPDDFLGRFESIKARLAKKKKKKKLKIEKLHG